MLIKAKNKINASISIVSMTDIIFLLLIFMLITANNHTKAIPVDLPVSTNKKTVVEQVHITVTAHLQHYIGGKIVPFNQLEQVLQATLAQASCKIVVLHMDKRLAIVHMVRVADIAHKLGASVSLATELAKSR